MKVHIWFHFVKAKWSFRVIYFIARIGPDGNEKMSLLYLVKASNLSVLLVTVLTKADTSHVVTGRFFLRIQSIVHMVYYWDWIPNLTFVAPSFSSCFFEESLWDVVFPGPCRNVLYPMLLLPWWPTKFMHALDSERSIFGSPVMIQHPPGNRVRWSLRLGLRASTKTPRPFCFGPMSRATVKPGYARETGLPDKFICSQVIDAQTWDCKPGSRVGSPPLAEEDTMNPTDRSGRWEAVA